MEEIMTYSDIVSLGGEYKGAAPNNISECPTKSEVESTFTNVTVGGGVQDNELVTAEVVDATYYGFIVKREPTEGIDWSCTVEIHFYYNIKDDATSEYAYRTFGFESNDWTPQLSQIENDEIIKHFWVNTATYGNTMHLSKTLPEGKYQPYISVNHGGLESIIWKNKLYLSPGDECTPYNPTSPNSKDFYHNKHKPITVTLKAGYYYLSN